MGPAGGIGAMVFWHHSLPRGFRGGLRGTTLHARGSKKYPIMRPNLCHKKDRGFFKIIATHENVKHHVSSKLTIIKGEPLKESDLLADEELEEGQEGK